MNITLQLTVKFRAFGVTLGTLKEAVTLMVRLPATVGFEDVSYERDFHGETIIDKRGVKLQYRVTS